MNNELLDQMVSLRRDGFTMKIIAERVGVSERTVRRYVHGVEPEIRTPSQLSWDELADSFFDDILAHRRGIVAAATAHWAEPFELRLESVDAAMRLLRERLEGMQAVSIRKLGADQSLRGEFLDDFLAEMGREWASELNTIRGWRNLVRQSTGYDERVERGDSDRDHD